MRKGEHLGTSTGSIVGGAFSETPKEDGGRPANRLRQHPETRSHRYENQVDAKTLTAGRNHLPGGAVRRTGCTGTVAYGPLTLARMAIFPRPVVTLVAPVTAATKALYDTAQVSTRPPRPPRSSAAIELPLPSGSSSPPLHRSRERIDCGCAAGVTARRRRRLRGLTQGFGRAPVPKPATCTVDTLLAFLCNSRASPSGSPDQPLHQGGLNRVCCTEEGMYHDPMHCLPSPTPVQFAGKIADRGRTRGQDRAIGRLPVIRKRVEGRASERR